MLRGYDERICSVFMLIRKAIVSVANFIADAVTIERMVNDDDGIIFK